ncbi:MAG: hypothetical protein ACHQFW_01780, partial [Chitinophagales bacterium]
MKSLFNLLFAVICIHPVLLRSQPVISSTVMEFTGEDSIGFYGQDITSFNPGPAGEDVVWNFSAREGEVNMQVYFNEGSNCGNKNSYQIIVETPAFFQPFSTTERQMLTDADNFSFCRIGGFELSMIFFTPYTLFKFPMTYNDNYLSEFNGHCDDGIFGDIGDFNGYSEATVDGYGTLILPGGIFEDVLRVKVVDSLGCNYSIMSSYWWFKEGYKGPLFRCIVTESGFNESIFVAEAGAALPLTTIDDQEDNQLIISPNPASCILNIISGNFNEYAIYD